MLKTTGATATADQTTETAVGTLLMESPLKPVAEGLEQPSEKTKEFAVAEKEASPVVSKGHFVIQVATFVIKDDATRLMEDLKKSEARVFIKGMTRASGKTYYSVFIGRFKNYQEAQQALAKFQKKASAKTFTDAFIRTLNN